MSKTRRDCALPMSHPWTVHPSQVRIFSLSLDIGPAPREQWRAGLWWVMRGVGGILGRDEGDNGHRPVTEENPAEGGMTRGSQAGGSRLEDNGAGTRDYNTASYFDPPHWTGF